MVDKADVPSMSDDAILSENLTAFSTAPVEDIPVALRDEMAAKHAFGRWNKLLLWGGSGLGLAIAIGIGAFLLRSPSSATSNQSTQATIPNATSSNSSAAGETDSATANRPAATTADGTTASAVTDDSLLGHLPYAEADPATLQAVTPDGGIQLRQAAAEKLLAMMAAAQADGVVLIPISGFRTIQEQETIFFEVKAERGQATTKRSEVSAPPGYSEHHTGYAVDLGDGFYSDTNLQVEFESTPAFQWLSENAAFYSFELSFPKNNSDSRVSYEPWHWRFVGDRDSLETFYRARSNGSQAESTQTETSPDETISSEATPAESAQPESN